MDRADFHTLYERHAPDVLRFALYLSGNRAEAEDLAAEAFARAWTATDPIRTATVKAHLFAIVRNLVRERARRQRPQGEPAEEPVDPPERDDELDFTSEPLASAVEITGPIRAVLSVSTDAKDTDFTASLSRIAPDGRVTAVLGGIQRLRYRSGYAREDFAKPGELSTLTIEMWSTSLRLEPGTRLHVLITSNGFPGTARNLNTGEPDFSATHSVVAHQSVFHDPERPSYLLLPVIPRAGSGELEFAPAEQATEHRQIRGGPHGRSLRHGKDASGSIELDRDLVFGQAERLTSPRCVWVAGVRTR